MYYEVVEHNENMGNKHIVCAHLSIHQVSYNLLKKIKCKLKVTYFLSK